MKKFVNCRNIFNNFNYAKMNRLLDNNNRKTRNKLKNLFKKDVYKPRYNLSLNQERDLAYERLKNYVN